MCTTIVSSQKRPFDDIDSIKDLRKFGVDESCFIIGDSYESFTDDDCLCVLDIKATFEQASLFLEQDGAMEHIPVCPACREPWTTECFDGGCWGCGYIAKAPLS